jgi:hypothetical protein
MRDLSFSLFPGNQLLHRTNTSGEIFHDSCWTKASVMNIMVFAWKGKTEFMRFIALGGRRKVTPWELE